MGIIERRNISIANISLAGADLETAGNVDGQADSALCAGRRGSGRHHHQHQHHHHQHWHHHEHHPK